MLINKTKDVYTRTNAKGYKELKVADDVKNNSNVVIGKGTDNSLVLNVSEGSEKVQLLTDKVGVLNGIGRNSCSCTLCVLFCDDVMFVELVSGCIVVDKGNGEGNMLMPANCDWDGFATENADIVSILNDDFSVDSNRTRWVGKDDVLEIAKRVAVAERFAEDYMYLVTLTATESSLKTKVIDKRDMSNGMIASFEEKQRLAENKKVVLSNSKSFLDNMAGYGEVEDECEYEEEDEWEEF